MLNEVGVLMAKANEDKTVCEILDVSAKRLDAIICFHAQQMAEKIVKALWKKIYPEKVIVKSHDIGLFLEDVSDIYVVSDEMRSWADNLTKLEASTRYMQQEHIDESSSKTAMYQANKIYDWVMDCIRQHECGNDDSSQIGKI